MRTRTLVLAVALSLVLITGSGAFTTSVVDRQVSVTVVDDERAYVGYESHDVTVNGSASDSPEVPLVTITNRFQSPIEIVSVETSREDIEVEVVSGAVGTGEQATVTLIECDPPIENETVHVTVEIDGEGVRVTIFGETAARAVTVDCHT